jgi:hypothetical protein
MLVWFTEGDKVIKTIKIFPPIGIARLGNSKDGYFIGPEKVGDIVIPADGFRDSAKLIKRQAARFRMFAFDENDALVKELTSDDGNISWTVHVANTKAAAEWFHPKSENNPKQRNADFAGDRSQLKLDPGSESVGGKSPDFADLNKSRAQGTAKDLLIDQLFLNKPVRFVLGTITTDDQGRLLVLGGHGESQSPVGATLSGGNFANHDGWYDDVSDGIVSASITLNDGNTPPVVGAWVIVAPPKYVPGLKSPVSLYETLFQAAIDRGLMQDPLANPSFKPSLTEDIVPILLRAANMRWVYDNGTGQFSPAAFHHSFNQMPPADRAVIFNRLATPSSTPGNPGSGAGDMPRMWSDLYPDGANGTLTQTQYRMMEMWKDGNFVTGSAPDGSISPAGLTRAALEPCVGGPFFPGIEASWKLRDEFPFVEPFRIDSSQVTPGDITSQMSLPWQSDFLDCAVEAGSMGQEFVWWPAQRPVAVLRAGSGNAYIPWGRTTSTGSTEMSVEQMISDWYKLGFVIAQPNGRFEETDRL